MRTVRPLASEPPVSSPYLTAKEASVYLRFAHVSALYHAIATAGVPVCRRGRSLLFHRAQLDRWLAGESKVVLLGEARSRRHVNSVDAVDAERNCKSVAGVSR
jgi:excisionase family DNA binding protein